MLRESLSKSRTIKKRIKYKKKIKERKKRKGRKRKNASPPTQFMHPCPNFLDELPRKHLLHTRDIVPLLVEGANFCFLIFWTFVGSPPALTQKKDRGMFLLYSTRPSLPLATIMEVWRSPFFRGERAWTDQRFFFPSVYLFGKQQTFANNKWLDVDIIFVVQGSEEVCLTA